MHAFAKIAVIGSTGQLGHDLLQALKGLDVTGLSHDDVSIEDPGSVEAALERVGPDLVVNTAAFHNVPACETRQHDALRVNTGGVANLAAASARRGIALATVSTDYVFDGSKGSAYDETDEAHPINVYGLSKLGGEVVARALLPAHFIFRTSGLFGRLGSKSKGYTFIDKVLAQARAGETVRVVDDMTFSPSYTRHVAAWMRRILERAPFGTYHLTNRGACTWHEFAQYAISSAGLAVTVEPIPSSAFDDGVRRPRNSGLAHPALLAAGIEEPPHWKRAVEEYLEERSFNQAPLS